MIVSNNSLQQVGNHWAVLAVGETERDRGLMGIFIRRKEIESNFCKIVDFLGVFGE